MMIFHNLIYRICFSDFLGFLKPVRTLTYCVIDHARMCHCDTRDLRPCRLANQLIKAHDQLDGNVDTDGTEQVPVYPGSMAAQTSIKYKLN